MPLSRRINSNTEDAAYHPSQDVERRFPYLHHFDTENRPSFGLSLHCRIDNVICKDAKSTLNRVQIALKDVSDNGTVSGLELMETSCR
jgi:hypothetical protein